MDFEFIETLLNLPECRVIGQVLKPNELQLQLERRESYLHPHKPPPPPQASHARCAAGRWRAACRKPGGRCWRKALGEGPWISWSTSLPNEAVCSVHLSDHHNFDAIDDAL